MFPKDRVRAAFENRQSDHVPIYQSGFSSRVASDILGRVAHVGGGIQQYREACALWEGPDAHAEFLERSIRDAIDVSLALELDMVRPFYWRMPVKPSRRIDEFTFLWDDRDGAHRVHRFDPERELFPEVERSPLPPASFEELEVLLRSLEDAAAGTRIREHAEVARAVDELGDTHAVCGYGAMCNVPYDPRIWLEAVLLRPDLVARRLDVYVEEARRTIPKIAKLGTPYIFGGGDFASSHGPFVSPQAFRELVLPRLKEIAKICHDHGAYYMFASDGNLWSVADALFGESGVDAFFEMDVLAGMDPVKLRRAYPSLTLLGGINSKTVHLGPPEAIRREVHHAMDAAREFGGMIVGCSNQLVVGTPIEHVNTMMEEIHRLR